MADAPCPACERGERILTPPATTVLRSMPVHFPSGNVCVKAMPQEEYDALQKFHAKRRASQEDGQP